MRCEPVGGLRRCQTRPPNHHLSDAGCKTLVKINTHSVAARAVKQYAFALQDASTYEPNRPGRATEYILEADLSHTLIIPGS